MIYHKDPPLKEITNRRGWPPQLVCPCPERKTKPVPTCNSQLPIQTPVDEGFMYAHTKHSHLCGIYVHTSTPHTHIEVVFTDTGRPVALLDESDDAVRGTHDPDVPGQ